MYDNAWNSFQERIGGTETIKNPISFQIYSHFCVSIVRNCLPSRFPRKWTGRAGLISRSARLNPLDFYFRATWKQLCIRRSWPALRYVLRARI